jgi:hypothetical protein
VAGYPSDQPQERRHDSTRPVELIDNAVEFFGPQFQAPLGVQNMVGPFQGGLHHEGAKGLALEPCGGTQQLVRASLNP